MDDAMRERELRPVRDPFAALLGLDADSARPNTLLQSFERFLRPVAERAQGRVDERAGMADFRTRLTRLTGLPVTSAGRKASNARRDELRAGPEPGPAGPSAARAFLWPWTILRPLCGADPLASPVPSWLHEWMLAPILSDHLSRTGWDAQSARGFPALFEVALRAEDLAELTGPAARASRRSAARGTAAAGRPARKTRGKAPEQPPWQELLGMPAAESFLRVHLFEGVRWFSKEALELLLACLALAQPAESQRRLDAGPLLESAAKTGYRWNEFLASLDPGRT
jgi:hypothetical protein